MGDQAADLPEQMQRLVERLADESCLDLFDAYGVSLEKAQPSLSIESSLTAVVGFTGRGFTGMCLLASAEEVLLASRPVESELGDWVGELANQLAGRIKRKLLGEGIEVFITTPIVLRATRIEPLPRHRVSPRAFSAGGAGVSLWTEVEVSAEFRVGLSPEEEAPMAEGEALIF